MGCLQSCLAYLRDCWESLCAYEPTYGPNPWLEILGAENYFSPNREAVEIDLSHLNGAEAEAGPEDYMSLLPEDLQRRILSMLDDTSLMHASMAFLTWGDICRREPALRVRIQDQLIREVPGETLRGITTRWRHLLFMLEAVEPPPRVRWADESGENQEASDPR